MYTNVDDRLGAAPTGALGKVRPVGVINLLSVVTLGIYTLIWQYKTLKEMKDHTGHGLGGGYGLLFAILFDVVNWFEIPAEVGNLYAAELQPKPVVGLTGLWRLLPLIGDIVWLVKIQRALNRYWLAHGAPA